MDIYRDLSNKGSRLPLFTGHNYLANSPAISLAPAPLPKPI